MYDQDEDKKTKAKRICEKFAQLQTNRTNWETHWQECLDYIIPRKADVVRTRTPGQKRGNDLFDTTAIQANQLLAGALHGMLTNPAVRFFDLTFMDEELDSDEEVQLWLQDSADRMFNTLNNTNFQTEIHEIYIDQGAIGTACLFMGEHEENLIHFSARNMAEIYVEENNLGIIDVVYRKFSWNARKIVQEFGEENVPEYIKKCYEKGDPTVFAIIHAVEAKDDEDQSPYEFKSCYVLLEKEFLLSESGFREFPYAVPRWTKTSGEEYGRGPGMDMLPDIKMVDSMMEVTLKGAQKTIDPPLMISDDGVIGNVRLTPGGLTVVRPTNDVPIRPLITDARIDFGYQAVEDVRRRIRAGFFVDQLQLNEGPTMTATEVMQRTEEKLRLMGPVLGRQHFELLRPLIDRLFGIMYRRGKLLPPPQKVQGKKLDVRYSSLIARSQRMNEGQNLTRAISVAAPIIQLDQGVVDNLDTDKTFKHILDIYGVSKKLNRPDKEIKDMRAGRAQAQAEMIKQQQRAQQAQQFGQVAPGVAQLAQAEK